VPETPSEAWGTDEPGPPPEVKLAADLPPDAPADDEDPSTLPIAEAPSAQLGDDVVSAIGVRFVVNGRISWFDAGEADYAVGQKILVDGERGSRLATVAIAPSRKSLAGRERPRRVIRRANDHDLRGEREGEADRGKALRIAKDVAAALRMPLKVFRVELAGPSGRVAKANVYYTSDERLDMRDLIRDLTRELARTFGGNPRIELRQLGVRDEAKAVGGIGSCGLTLCCTTWLPDFVPVSIKMAKDQGLVLSPTKVSGQCGRLKCCLVYEQAGYAELRKGLPKLGKRVIGARGEGRVVEVDVLRQRVRVSYGPGDTEVVPATEVRPLFPSGQQPSLRPSGPQPSQGDEKGDEPGDETDDAPVPETDDPSAVALLLASGVRHTPPSISAEIPADEPSDEATDEPTDDLADVPDLPDEDPSRDPNADD
jgi:cell fate regulator YaaT (PSP1 superfamily)